MTDAIEPLLTSFERLSREIDNLNTVIGEFAASVRRPPPPFWADLPMNQRRPRR